MSAMQRRSDMDIGEDIETIVIEPLEVPVPKVEPAREPEQVPA